MGCTFLTQTTIGEERSTRTRAKAVGQRADRLPSQVQRSKRRPARAFLAPALAALVASAVACAPPGPPVYTVVGKAFGTTWTLKLVDHDENTDQFALNEIVETALDRVDRAASTWREDSEISAALGLEAGQAMEVSTDLIAILDVAREVYDATEGAFDPTVGPLVAAYGFGAGASETPPTEAELSAAAERLGFEAFAWEDGTLTRSRDDVSLDLSGVAKGYAVDLVAQTLLAAGETDFMLEVGGEIRVAGVRTPETLWRLGIFEPVEFPALHGSIRATDMAIATSGDYRAFRDLPDGTRVSHTIDPRLGRVAQSGVASVTITAQECARADALATAVMVLGADEGLAVVESLPGVEAYLLLHAEEGFTPRASSGFLEVTPWTP